MAIFKFFITLADISFLASYVSSETHHYNFITAVVVLYVANKKCVLMDYVLKAGNKSH